MCTFRTLILGGLASVAFYAASGCGALSAKRDSFANQAATSTGQPLFVENIEEIVLDDTLTADEQREALRELGIEDEDLIEALLTLPSPDTA